MAEYYIDVHLQFPAMAEPQKLRVTPRLALLLNRRMEHMVLADGVVVYRQPSTPLPLEEIALLSREVAEGLMIEGPFNRL